MPCSSFKFQGDVYNIQFLSKRHSIIAPQWRFIDDFSIVYVVLFCPAMKSFSSFNGAFYVLEFLRLFLSKIYNLNSVVLNAHCLYKMCSCFRKIKQHTTSFLCSLSQLHECLAQLITENLEVTRWLFKLDDEFGGRGIAYIDVSQHLSCYNWALKEAAR